MDRMRRALALVVAGAFVVAACGSDSEQLSEEEFLAAANEICEVGNEEVVQLFEELEPLVEDIFATAATEEEVEQFFQDEGGKVRDAYLSNVQGQVSDVRDLNGPDDLEEELDPLLDEASDEVDAVSELSVEEFFDGEWEAGFTEINSQIQALGLTTCAEDAG
jgi:ABC-type glycerol-3-phosphate transport system substrate-binding protein